MIINGGAGVPLRRMTPKMAPQFYKTYAIRMPHAYRQAPCSEIQCDGYVNGWVMHKERMNPDLVFAVTHSGRSFKEMNIAPGQTLLVFEAGQTCFKSIDDAHRVAIPTGDEVFLAGRGDFRMFDPRRARVHTKPEHWVEDMQLQFDANNRLKERG